MKAIISGATKGIGRACALKLAKAGFQLCLISRKQENLEDLKSEILKTHDVDVQLLSLDLSNSKAINKVDWDKVIGDESDFLLINNLGGYEKDKASEIKVEEIEELMKLNLYSAIQLTGFFTPKMRSEKQGQIVNILSVNAIEADKNATAYSMSKQALKAWNDALREELRSSGIKVTAIYPGAVNTASWDGLKVDKQAMLQSEDIAQMILSLSKLSKSALVEEIRMNPMNFGPN